jgi:hypothetical protein
MKETLQEKILIGISLKAISKNKKTANKELANMGSSAGARAHIDWFLDLLNVL